MYATTSIRNAWRKLKTANEGYLLALGQGEFFEFVLDDALQIVRALPDVEMCEGVRYSAVKVHQLGFFPFCARLTAKGFKVAIVSRQLIRKHGVRYRVTGRSDD